MTKRIKGATEAKIQLDILKYLRGLGAWGGKVKVKGGFGGKGKFFFDPYTFVGFPDLCFFFKNTLWFIEVKRPERAGTFDEMSIEQKVFRQKCIEAGVNHIVAHSVAEIRQILNADTPEKIVEILS